jgi:hypothetical protein
MIKNTSIATLAVVLLASLAAHSAQLNSEAFTWYAELVALDANARILTVKAPVVGEQAPADFGRLKAGANVMLTWSGYDKSADAIREVRSSGVIKPEERFTFPADFVSFDTARRYATFKIQIPDSNVANVKSLKPGEWVTATSPHGPSSKSTPIVNVRPYVGSSSAANSNQQPNS